jgi:hypothetical protein
VPPNDYILAMPFNLRRTIPVFLLIVYAASLMLVMSPHCDAESAFGTGMQSVSSHADAANCKHADLSHAETCSLCSFFAGRAIFLSSPLLWSTAQEIIIGYSPLISSSYSLLSLGSSSHRGPPNSQTIA